MNPVKFRCYRCGQLLGVSRQKIGEVVACPRCLAELVVPDPAVTDTPAGDDEPPSPAGALDSGVPLNYLDLRPEDIRAEHSPGFVPPTTASEPPDPAPRAVEPEPRPPEPVGVATSHMATEPAPPMIPPIRVDGQAERAHQAGPAAVRSRDLILPRSVVASWSLFVLLALVLAFFAGLLAGHFVWRVH